ncbi:MAG: FlgD immunoglobulin-like domain containing protein [bacterium]
MNKLIQCLALFLLIPTALMSQVRINEVLYNTASASDDRIELKNFGSTSVDVSGWWLCTLASQYDQIRALTIVSGSTNMAPGSILALRGKSLLNSADLALYATDVFTSTSAIRAFVQWGAGGQGREGVAVGAGLWTRGAFVPAVDQGHSIEYDGEGNEASDWADQASPTIGAENGILTSVEGGAAGTPSDFRLEQNYPNPFNPSTVITYTIPQSVSSTDVRLEIFNVLGQEAKTLVNARQPAGTYSVRWDGTNNAGIVLANGIYVYRLKAAGFVAIRKMLFTK